MKYSESISRTLATLGSDARSEFLLSLAIVYAGTDKEAAFLDHAEKAITWREYDAIYKPK